MFVIWDESAARAADAMVRRGPSATQAAILRGIVGNPFREVLVYSWHKNVTPRHDDRRVHVRREWFTPAVLLLAQAAYEETGRECDVCGGAKSVIEHRSGEVRGSVCPACNDTGRTDDGTLDPVHLAVLADALEEAGCPTEEECKACGGHGWTGKISLSGDKDRSRPCPAGCHRGVAPYPLLAHLRKADAPRYRGDWALDLVLGKD